MLQTITTRFKGKGCIESLIGGRSENQDSAGWSDTPFGLLVVVCDGMGGMKGGKHASELAVDTIIADVSSASAEESPLPVLQKAIAHANTVIFNEGLKDEYKGMGTTLVALLVTDQNAIAVHLGDSRIYQLRNGKKHFRTFDHSMVFDMVKANILSEEQARLADCSNIILKALGISESVTPDIEIIPYRKGDRFVLCTDGFWSAFDEMSLVKKLSKKEVSEILLESLSKEIDQLGKDNGGNHDNLTAAVLDVDKNSVLKDTKPINILKILLYVLLFLSLCFNLYAIKAFYTVKQVRKELIELYNDLTDAQEELTSQKISKILEKTGGVKSSRMENDNANEEINPNENDEKNDIHDRT